MQNRSFYDHTDVDIREESKHKLLWKFNNSLLKDKLFAEEINHIIKAVAEEYAALP